MPLTTRPWRLNSRPPASIASSWPRCPTPLATRPRRWYSPHHLPFSPLQNFDWAEESTLNNLSDVHQLHCGGPPLRKEARDVFVKGSMQDIRNDFQVHTIVRPRKCATFNSLRKLLERVCSFNRGLIMCCLNH